MKILKAAAITAASIIALHFAFSLAGYPYLYKAIAYNFADIDDYTKFENRTIKASPSPQPWPIGSDYNQLPLTDSLKELHARLESIAFIIIKDDSIRMEHYWDGYKENSLSGSFSMAKTYVSALIGIAVGEGKIKNVQQPVGDFLPEFKEGKKAKITIEHLLTMGSGLEWDESYSNPFSVTTAAYYGDDLKKLVDNINVEYEPGKTFAYRGGNTQILAFILEKATGKSLSEYASEKLWKPTGAERNALWSLDKKDGMEKAYCCINSNARDFARLGQLYLQNGNWKGKQIIPLDYLTASIIPADLVDETGNEIDYYGYQWWLIPSYKGQNIFYARGILGQYIIVIPEKNIVVVRLGKKRDEKIGMHPAEVLKMIDETNKLY